MQDYRRLDVWKQSHELTLMVYKFTTGFPATETYGLTSQVRRAASSIPANIAEGCGRDGGLDFARFLQIAQGSAGELDYHLLLGRDLALLNENDYVTLTTNLTIVRKMLTSLIRRVRPISRKPGSQPPRHVANQNQ